MSELNAEQLVLDNGYEDVVILKDYSYDTALIGITTDNRAVYDYDLMIEWLVKHESMSIEEAAEWIDYNTLGALPYAGGDGPLVMFRLIE